MSENYVHGTCIYTCRHIDFLYLENTNAKKSIDQLRREVEGIFNRVYGMYVTEYACMYGGQYTVTI